MGTRWRIPPLLHIPLPALGRDSWSVLGRGMQRCFNSEPHPGSARKLDKRQRSQEEIHVELNPPIGYRPSRDSPHPGDQSGSGPHRQTQCLVHNRCFVSKHMSECSPEDVSFQERCDLNQDSLTFLSLSSQLGSSALQSPCGHLGEAALSSPTSRL